MPKTPKLAIAEVLFASIFATTGLYLVTLKLIAFYSVSFASEQLWPIA